MLTLTIGLLPHVVSYHPPPPPHQPIVLTWDSPEAAIFLSGILQSNPEAHHSWWVGVQKGAVLVNRHLPPYPWLLQHSADCVKSFPLIPACFERRSAVVLSTSVLQLTEGGRPMLALSSERLAHCMRVSALERCSHGCHPILTVINGSSPREEMQAWNLH
jgi:hypothetical protein